MAEFFTHPLKQIYGADIRHHPEDPRLLQADQSNAQDLARLAAMGPWTVCAPPYPPPSEGAEPQLAVPPDPPSSPAPVPPLSPLVSPMQAKSRDPPTTAVPCGGLSGGRPLAIS